MKKIIKRVIRIIKIQIKLSDREIARNPEMQSKLKEMALSEDSVVISNYPL
jgi:hypothetical protein